jgi:peptidoglycan/xylan/chitin deacetylase (PgdA/CDA1 family)
MKRIILLLIILLALSGCSPNIKTFIGNDSATQKNNVLGENIARFKGYPNEPKGTETQVPILMYHYVRVIDKDEDLLGYNLSIDPDILDSQLKWLKDNGYKTITTKNIIENNVYKKSVILIFDDGYEDFYTQAFPKLKKYELTAEVAIITKQIDTPGYLKEKQIKEMVDYGIEIASHTVSHFDLTTREKDDLKYELANSKSYLEEKFGTKINALVYPYGKYNDNIIKRTRKAGYLLGISTKPGIANLQDNLFKINRIRIDNRDDLEGFINKLSSY